MLSNNGNVSTKTPILMLISIILLVQDACAATYYVSPTGSNENPGSLEDPWANPAYGASQLQPGGHCRAFSLRSTGWLWH